MTDVHHCPSCELVFRNKTELEYHWAEEHDPQLQAAVEDAVEAEREQREQQGGEPPANPA